MDSFSGISDQSKSSVHRGDDARALFEARRWRGAMYMARYSVECLLKAKLMRIYNCRNLNELEDELQRRKLLGATSTIFVHQLAALLRLANGLHRLQQNAAHWRLFSIVNRWIPAWRYNPDLSNADDADDFLKAVDKIRHWIDSNL